MKTMYVVRVGTQEYLGRRTVGGPLRPVGRVHAYEFATWAHAARLANNFARDIRPDAEVVVEEVL